MCIPKSRVLVIAINVSQTVRWMINWQDSLMQVDPETCLQALSKLAVKRYFELASVKKCSTRDQMMMLNS